MANIRPIRFVRLQSGCFVSLSHRMNQDGYFRKRWNVDGNTESEMFHRFMWRVFNGEIPEGKEIHHKCNVRACCNIDHLELIGISEHKRISNRSRYKERHQKAKRYWKSTGCSGTDLGNRFGVSDSTACRWIRKWEEEESRVAS